MSTQRQLDALRFIERFMAEHDGLCPSFDEIGSAIGLRAKSGVHRIIDALQADGLVHRLYGRARNITVGRRASGVSATVPLGRELDELLAAYCEDSGYSPSTVIREAVAAYFGVELGNDGSDHQRDADAGDAHAEPEPFAPPLRREDADLA